MSASSPREGNNTGRWLLVMVLSAILIAFIIIQPMPSFGNDLTCGNAEKVLAERLQEVDDLDRADYTSGPSGGEEFRSDRAELVDSYKEALDKVKECDKEEDSDEGTSTTTAPPADDPTGTPGDPCVGSQCNTNPVLSEVRSWTELVKAVEAEPDGGQWYWGDLQQFNGISEESARSAAELEKQGNDLRLILISNDQVSDSDARAQLKAQGVEGVDGLPIVRVNGFINTRGLPHDRMEPFQDDRSQVRVSLALPLNWNDLSKGLESTRGVLTMCANGWKLKSETPVTAPPATPTPRQPTPTSPPVTPTTRPYVPPTTAPPTTQPPTTTTTRPPTTTTTEPKDNPSQGTTGD